MEIYIFKQLHNLIFLNSYFTLTLACHGYKIGCTAAAATRHIIYLYMFNEYLENQSFRFDYAFDENVTNEMVYRYVCVIV